jgi:hypothetical protein
MIYEFEFQFESHPTIWLRADVTTAEALECLKTGLLRNSIVSKVKAFAISESDNSVTFVYDISAAKSGTGQPWSVISAP